MTQDSANWKPIETYDALAVKPKHAAFIMKGVPPNRGGMGKWSLPPMVSLTRLFGSREATYWYEIPDIPKEAQ